MYLSEKYTLSHSTSSIIIPYLFINELGADNE